MPSREPSHGRRRRPPVPGTPVTRPAGPRIALVTLVAVGLIAAAGGQAVWLSVPAALIAAAGSEGRGRAIAGAGVVIALTAAAALAWAAPAGRPPLALVALIGAACTAILVIARARVEHERDVLRDFALSDPVTGISNRRSLLIRADYEIARHRRAQRNFALVMLDLDGFKQLNDRFGHAAGDDLLRDVAAALTRAMRGQDTVARFGGDEFCILAPETNERGSDRLAAKVAEAVRDVSVGMEAVHGSVGVAIFPVDGTNAADLMHVADERLLQAKRRRPGARAGRRAAA
ncbi:MAG: GGDEF domain-containing protein [Solirubrobacteraceae bacterium]